MTLNPLYIFFVMSSHFIDFLGFLATVLLTEFGKLKVKRKQNNYYIIYDESDKNPAKQTIS